MESPFIYAICFIAAFVALFIVAILQRIRIRSLKNRVSENDHTIKVLREYNTDLGNRILNQNSMMNTKENYIRTLVERIDKMKSRMREFCTMITEELNHAQTDFMNKRIISNNTYYCILDKVEKLKHFINITS